LSGVDLTEARNLISRLPDSVKSELDAISPSSAVANLSARVLIMHDREDRLVPSEESQRLAEALSERGNVYHTEFSLFDHLDPTRPVSPPVYAKELFKLYMHMYNVLRDLR
jgi:pimeloyl-ACP methyl ester carboxylesterase